MIRITSKKAGFRRCGMPHPKKPVAYPDDRFSEEEIEILKAETMLIVESFDLEALDRVIPVEEQERADALDKSAEKPTAEVKAADEETEATPGDTAAESVEEPARHASPQGEAGGSAPIETEAVTPVVDFNEWTVKQLTELLEKRGIEIPKKARKAELIALLSA